MKSESNLSFFIILTHISAGAHTCRCTHTPFCQTVPNVFPGWTDRSPMEEANLSSLQRQEQTSTHYPDRRYMLTYVEMCFCPKRACLRHCLQTTTKSLSNFYDISAYLPVWFCIWSWDRYWNCVSPNCLQSHTVESRRKPSTTTFLSPADRLGWANYRVFQDTALKVHLWLFFMKNNIDEF